MFRFLDHTQPVGLQINDKLVAEAATYTTHNHIRQTSTASPEFEPAISGIKGLQTYA